MPDSTASIIGRSLRIVAVGLIAGGALVASTPEVHARFRPNLADRLRYGPGVLNHPVHVVPSAAVSLPGHWPVDTDGSITCATCHETLPSFETVGEFNLRGIESGVTDRRAFCIQCHRGGDQRSASSMHWMAMGQAHINPDADRAKPSYGTLDAESRRCLGCHDGVNASEHANAPLAAGMGYIGDRQRSHPIGVPYRSMSRQRMSGPLRPKSLLPDAVRLPGGSVSCVSCHNLYAGEPHLLSVPIEGSQLCLTCHEMD